MTTLASRTPYPAPTHSSNMGPSHYRVATATAMTGHPNVFTSPTESEFSESLADAREAVQDWDEGRVSDWLRSINCAQYVDVFKRNNINGENLMEMDQTMLKEMGVRKIGDRIRIGAQAKLFRNNVYKRMSKRVINRVGVNSPFDPEDVTDFHEQHSLAALDGNTTLTPPSSGSPRTLHSARPIGSRGEKRMSRQLGSADMKNVSHMLGKPSSRPSSPMVDQENRGPGMRRPGGPSPMESGRKDQNGSYFGQGSNNARYRPTPVETPQTARFGGHVKQSSSVDGLSSSNLVGALPSDKPLIRVIWEDGRASAINIDGFRTAEDIIRLTLRKGALYENHFRSYCFYVLDGTDPNPTFCRRIGEGELVKLCNDGVRSERGRLILRKIHAGEPEGEQLRTAARLAEQQLPEPPAIEVLQPNKTRSQLKIEKLTGEPLAAVSYPMSPASQMDRDNYFASQSSSVSRNASQASTASARARKLKDFYGARPPTELITQDLQSYFPEVNKEEMDRTVRMSIRRSRRISRAVSRLSTVSNVSIADSLRDAPPLPSIADQWLKDAGNQPRQAGLRPLSLLRLGRPDSYRESVTSSVLEPLDEESPLEPDRKSYVSFGPDSGSDTVTSKPVSVTDPEGNTQMQSYFDDTHSSPTGTLAESNSLNSRLSQFIAEDGEEEDEELMQHLEKDNWDDIKYMKGAMIGQGSFGTVFLALHAVTAELMAVKQVEMPSNSGTAAMDAKKNNMIEALKHEITLLREMKHPISSNTSAPTAMTTTSTFSWSTSPAAPWQRCSLTTARWARCSLPTSCARFCRG